MFTHNIVLFRKRIILVFLFSCTTVQANKEASVNPAYTSETIRQIKQSIFQAALKISSKILLKIMKDYFLPSELGTCCSKQKNLINLIESEELESESDLEPAQDDTNAVYTNDEKSTKLLQLLDSMGQESINKKQIVFLLVDIDNTFLFVDPNNLPYPTLTEKTLMNVFDNWLSEGNGKNNFVLIYNTARRLCLNDWRDSLNLQSLPTPHFIMHRTGMKVIPTSRKLEWLDTEDIHALQANSLILHETFDINFRKIQYAFSASIIDYEDSIFLSHCYNQTNSDTFVQIPHWNPQFSHFEETLKNICQSSEYYKGCYEETQSTYVTPDYKHLIYHDLSVNKGTAAIWLMHHLLPHLPQDYIAALFTAGDDLPDLPMIRLNLLGEAFQKPENRKDDRLLGALEKLNLNKSNFESVLETWKVGIISHGVSESLSHYLDKSREADWDDRLQKAEFPSFTAILKIVHDYLKTQP